MIIRYCDYCGNKIDGEHSRLMGELRKPGGPVLLRAEVVTAKNNVWNDGDFCKYCVVDAIMQADDRPKKETGDIPIPEPVTTRCRQPNISEEQ